MRLNPIAQLPSKLARNNHSLKAIIMDFYNSEDDYAEVEFDSGEYVSNQSLCDGLRKAVNALDLPVRVTMIQGGVYLERTE